MHIWKFRLCLLALALSLGAAQMPRAKPAPEGLQAQHLKARTLPIRNALHKPQRVQRTTRLEVRG